MRCTFDVASVEVVRWGKVGTVMGGDFVLLFGKQSEPAVIIVCSSVFGSI
jgi:hypothetical protein